MYHGVLIEKFDGIDGEGQVYRNHSIPLPTPSNIFTIMKMISKTVLLLWCAAGVHGTSSSINRCLGDCELASDNKLDLSGCSIYDEDIASGDLANCFDEVGRENIETLNLVNNYFTTLPEGIFDGMSSLVNLWFSDNRDLESLPENIFNGLVSLESLEFRNGKLSVIQGGLFQGLESLFKLAFEEHDISSLSEGAFDDLSALTFLDFADNDLFSLPDNIFDGLESLESLWIEDNNFIDLSPGIFSDLIALDTLIISGNPLTCLPFHLPTVFLLKTILPIVRMNLL